MNRRSLLGFLLAFPWMAYGDNVRWRKLHADNVEAIIVHHSASGTLTDAASIDRYHRSKGWLAIGYHFVVTDNGTVQVGRPVDAVGSHVKGPTNFRTLGVCLVGNGPRFPEVQLTALRRLLDSLRGTIGGGEREIAVMGHRDVARTLCPGFDAAHWYDTGEVTL